MNELLEAKRNETLDRIADALEGIGQELECISSHLDLLYSKENPLDGCISKTRAGNALCVTGNITNY